MLLLNDILHLEDLEKYKVRLNQKITFEGGKELPAQDVYFEDSEKYELACAWNGKSRELNREFVITFAEMKGYSDLWLFTGLYRVTDLDRPLKKDKWGYLEHSALAEEKRFNNFCGRLIIKFHKSSQGYIRTAESIFDQLQVHEILSEKYDAEYFKGYNNVDLTFSQLKHIITKQKADWKSALENNKGVYLIRDDKTFKNYVGSAYGKNMLWKRWTDYATTVHGGNKELRKLVEEKGEDYIKEHFHYSILENFVASVSDEYIINRESYWKKILQSHSCENGYNDN